MDTERAVTRLLVKFSDKRRGWVLTRRNAGRVSLTEFVRAFDAFLENEGESARRLRQCLPELRRMILHALEGWNRARRHNASLAEDVVDVGFTGEALTNVALLRRRGPRRREAVAFQLPPVRGASQTEGLSMKGEIIVGNEFAGAILGRRGATIQSVREQSGCQVHLCDSVDNRTRVIDIIGDEQQVMEAHCLVNHILHREYPRAFLKGIMVPMKSTIDMKMSIEMATYLTGMNRTTLSDIQATTAVAVTLHDVDGEETSKRVRLTGSFDKILEAHQAVMAVLDTYEAWLTSNQTLRRATEEQADITPHPPLRTAAGEALQMSTVWVMQPNGSCKATQVYLPPPDLTPPNPQPTLPTVQETFGRARVIGDPFGDGMTPRTLQHGVAPHTAAPALYTQLSQALIRPEQGQVLVLPAGIDAAPVTLCYPPSPNGATPTPVILQQSKHEAVFENARKGDVDFFTQPETQDVVQRVVTVVDEDGRTLLHIAVTSGRAELVQNLLQRGAQATVDRQDEEGWAPLHSAVSCGYVRVAELLLSHGAEVDILTSAKRTPLHYAASKGHVEILKVLLRHGAAVNGRDAVGFTPLHRAAAAGRLQTVRVLVDEASAALDVEDRYRKTPVAVAVESQHDNVVLFLAARGASLDVMLEGEKRLEEFSPKLARSVKDVLEGLIDIDDVM